MVGTLTAPNTTCDQLGEIPTLYLDECPVAENSSFTAISPDNRIQLLDVFPTMKEIYLLGLTIFSATAKLMFSVMFVLILMYPEAVHPIVSENFDGIHYVAHASLYLVIAFSAVMNTALMLYNRMDNNFFDRPEFLRYYVVICAFGICLQIGIYFMYEFDRTADLTSNAIGDIMGILLLLDIVHCALLMMFECSIRMKLNQLQMELEEQLVCGE